MAEHYNSREERRKQLNAQKNIKGKKKPASLAKKIILSIIALGIVGLLSGVAAFAYIVKDAPKLDPKLLKDPISSKILDKDGNLIAEVGSANREYVEYKDIPKVVEDAFIATEDYRFYQHHGIDFIRLGGAVMANLTHGFGSEGGSTITEQVVKNSFLSPKKTLSRKIQEAWLAYQLEQHYTKHQILEMYVNKIYFSENSNGVATAAKAYYGKNLKDLTLPEAAMIAGLPQSPNNYNPFKDENVPAATKRRNTVLSLMYQHGYISKTEMDNATKVSVNSDLVKNDQRQLNEKPYDSFVDEVIDEVKQAGDFDIFSDGLTIYTTVDQKAQLYVDKIMNTNDVVKFPDDQFQAGITLLDTKTGEIRAIGGGRNQQVKRGFNYAIDTRRQPGSTIKPILDYGPAIEYLNWGTYQMIDDKPIKYSSGVDFGNWDNRYLGPMTIRTALQLSRNTPAVQTLQQVGLENAKKFAISLGIPLKEIYESYAIGGLGGQTVGVSPMEMAGAYSAFGNKGFYTPPHAIKKIKLRDGTEIDTTPETKVVMKDSTAFMITDMLKSVLQAPGTGVAANVPGLPIAGKTGTTNYTDQELQQNHISSSKSVPDAWFTGYSTNFTISVWTGYSDRKTPIPPGDNQKIAQYIFKNLMSYVSNGVSTPDFTAPASVQQVKIEKGSMPAVLASPYTPDSQVSVEYAVKGHAPKTVSTNYSKISAPTNASASYDQTGKQIVLAWNYNNTTGSPVQYSVSVSLNGGTTQKLTTTTETGLKVANPTAGGKYTFTITAVGNGQTSDPATVSIDIPGTSDQGNTNQNANQPNTGGTPPATPPSGGTGGTGQTGTTNSNGGTSAGSTGGNGTTGAGGTTKTGGTTGTGTGTTQGKTQ
ncbi:MAG: PBP1A family penicillin-binding protein [Bacillota bacterium]|nr:PBP1A family penicillin-binding protein [Bacillota bacterium]